MAITTTKGQIFVLMTVALLGLVFISFQTFNIFEDTYTLQTRVDTMETFLSLLEQNLERQVYISGFRIIFLAEDNILSSGDYISNFTSFFEEAFINGSVNGVTQDIMTGATQSDILASINEKAAKMNLNASFENATISYYQTDPWFITLNFSFDFVIEDLSGLVSWNRRQTVIALVPVEGFADPLYVIETYALVPQIINQTPYSQNYVDGANVSNLTLHAEGNFYDANSNAPSFIKRLEGDFSADPAGIESFVNTLELSQQGIPTSTKSTIDYIYFSTNNPAYYSVSGMPSWFYIDGEDNHTNQYQVTGLLS